MNDFLRTAILGTGQVSQTSENTETAADELVTKLGDIERERALLLRAGALSVLRRAGFRATVWSEPLAIAPDETLRRASPKLSGMLRSLLQHEYREVLSEALEGMARVGLRLPEELLPLALDETDPETRELLLPVLGERGRFLSKQRDDWKWASAPSISTDIPADADELWAEGTTAERQALLTRVRSVDSARARSWVQSSFKADKPEQRASWLSALEVGLSAADIPLLQSALSDRSHMVRIAAARVLWRLPESDVAKSVQERALSLFTKPSEPVGTLEKLKRLMTSDVKLLVELPAEEFDKALEKLGIIEAAPHGVGRRQFWLSQFVSALNPNQLAEHLGSSAEALVTAATQHDLALPLLSGLTSGALRFEAKAWFAPLWDAWFSIAKPHASLEPRALERLTMALTLDERTPRLLRCLREGRDLELLAYLPRPWPEAIARALMAQVRSRAAAFMHLLPLGASRVPVAMVPVGLTLAPADDAISTAYDNSFEKFMSVIEFRRRLAEEMV